MTHTEPDVASAERSVRRKLPIGIRTFRTIREDGCYYVDKTPFIRRLGDEGTHCFLLRPRRFGRNLPAATIKELFEGNEPLLQGLAVPRGAAGQGQGRTSAHMVYKVRPPISTEGAPRCSRSSDAVRPAT